VGLPGENENDIINNILLTKSLADMYSFGPLIPTQGTPLGNEKEPDIDLVLKIIAISRLVDADSKILVTTALETLDSSCKKLGLMAGANSLMINVTPARYKALYSIYQNRVCNSKELKKNIEETLELLYSLGRAPTDLGV
jgi:biotin synthase